MQPHQLMGKDTNTAYSTLRLLLSKRLREAIRLFHPVSHHGPVISAISHGLFLF